MLLKSHHKSTEGPPRALVGLVESLHSMTQEEAKVLSGFEQVDLGEERLHLIICAKGTVLDLGHLMSKKTELSSHRCRIPA